MFCARAIIRSSLKKSNLAVGSLFRSAPILMASSLLDHHALSQQLREAQGRFTEMGATGHAERVARDLDSSRWSCESYEPKPCVEGSIHDG